MKKNIVIGIACLIMSFQQLAAQETFKANAAVSKKFEEKFPGAVNVSWVSLPRKIAQAQFNYNGGSWLAFFDYTGDVITSGRRIKSIDNLPLKVQAGVSRAKERMERKGGLFQIALVYEMTTADNTQYLCSMQSDAIVATFSISNGGTPALEHQKPLKTAPLIIPDAIATKN